MQLYIADIYNILALEAHALLYNCILITHLYPDLFELYVISFIINSGKLRSA